MDTWPSQLDGVQKKLKPEGLGAINALIASKDYLVFPESGSLYRLDRQTRSILIIEDKDQVRSGSMANDGVCYISHLAKLYCRSWDETSIGPRRDIGAAVARARGCEDRVDIGADAAAAGGLCANVNNGCTFHPNRTGPATHTKARRRRLCEVENALDDRRRRWSGRRFRRRLRALTSSAAFEIAFDAFMIGGRIFVEFACTALVEMRSRAVATVALLIVCIIACSANSKDAAFGQHIGRQAIPT
jgi:hypothetical protein